jgi:hypothetical protein
MLLKTKESTPELDEIYDVGSPEDLVIELELGYEG